MSQAACGWDDFRKASCTKFKAPPPKKKQLKNFVTSSHVTALLEAGTQEKRNLKWVFFIMAS
jgi:hypothetical protein